MATTYDLPDPQTIPVCDRQLNDTREARAAALDRGDLDAFDKADERLQHLLEVRFHLPQQRTSHD